jgi:hypothetical protein
VGAVQIHRDLQRARARMMNIPSPIKVFRNLYLIFDTAVLLTLLGFARILKLLGVIRLGWIVIHWWRGDLKR